MFFQLRVGVLTNVTPFYATKYLRIDETIAAPVRRLRCLVQVHKTAWRKSSQFSLRGILFVFRGEGISSIGRRFLELRNNKEPVDLPSPKGFQEFGIILQGDASIRLTIGAEHIGMRKHAVAPVHFSAVDRIEPNSLNAVKKLFSQSEMIDVWWSWSSTLLFHVPNII